MEDGYFNLVFNSRGAVNSRAADPPLAEFEGLCRQFRVVDTDAVDVALTDLRNVVPLPVN